MTTTEPMESTDGTTAEEERLGPQEKSVDRRWRTRRDLDAPRWGHSPRTRPTTITPGVASRALIEIDAAQGYGDGGTNQPAHNNGRN